MLRWTTILIAISSLALVTACEASEDDDAMVTADTGGTDTVQPPAGYFAVLIEDSTTHDCSNNSKNHGADMDAMELVDGSDSLAFADQVDGQVGDSDGSSSLCGDINPDKIDLNEFKGAPDGSLSDGFVALGGGYLIAEFSGALEILPAYTLMVYEVGVNECGSQGCLDETYTVSVTPGLTNFTDKTTVSSTAAGTATLDLTGI